MQICKNEGDFALMHKSIYARDYIDGGISKNLLKNQLKSPRGMALYYKTCIEVEKYDIKRICKHVVGYICFSKSGNEKNIIKNSPRKILTTICYLPGVLLYMIYYKKQDDRHK